MESSVKTEWRTRISAIAHSAGFSYPVFHWIDKNNPTRFDGREVGLTAYSWQGMFQILTPHWEFNFEDIEELRSKIKFVGWSVPANFDEIAHDIADAHEKFRNSSDHQLFHRLGEKWARIADDASFPY